jgi:uncharacterized membrane protein
MAISIKPQSVNAARTARIWPMGQSRVIVFLVTLVLCAGLLFRVSHLERKAYWGDEVYSSLRVLGFKTTEVAQAIATGQPMLAAAVQKYQQPAPNKGLDATVKVLAQEDAHLTPLYFVLGRIWVEGFGSSVVAMRSLSVLFSLLALPACYWLSRELFDSVPIAWLSVILNVISPIYLVYAQEARMYSLWSLATIVAMAALLQALRQNTGKSWGMFSLALTLQLYSHLFSLVMLVAYALYVMGLRIGNPAVNLRRFSLAAATALLAFVPWLWVFFHRSVQAKVDEAAGEANTVLSTIKHLAGTFSRLFIDLNANSKTPLLPLMGSLIAGLLCLVVVLYGSYALYRETGRRVWLLVLLIVVMAPIGPLYAYHNLILSPRYLLPGYMGLQLVTAYILGTRIFGHPHPKVLASAPKPGVWLAALGAIVAFGLLSCGTMIASDTWWNKQYSNCNTQSAQLINQSPNPLVISDVSNGVFFDHPMSNILSLTTALKPAAHLQIFSKDTPVQIAVGFSDRFVITPSPSLRSYLEKTYDTKFQKVYLGSEGYRGSSICLWKLTE